MTKKPFFLVVTYSILIFVLNECNYYSPAKKNGDIFTNNLIKSINPLFKKNNISINIDLYRITPFIWDTVYYFSGETSSMQISNAIGFKWDGPGLSDDNRRLLFVHNTNVTAYADFNKIALNGIEPDKLPVHFYFCQEDINSHIEFCSKRSAKFTVSKSCILNRVDYTFTNTLCKK